MNSTVIDSSPADMLRADWHLEYNRRKLRQKNGLCSNPLNPVCRRLEIPRNCRLENIYNIRVIEELQKIDPRYEIIYDQFTVTKGGPGYHLYYRLTGDGFSSSDILQYKFSIQGGIRIEQDPLRVTVLPWPDGGPKMPGLWIIEIVKAARLAVAHKTEKERLKEHENVVKKKRAKLVKKTIDREIDIMNQLEPYVLQGRNLRKTKSLIL